MYNKFLLEKIMHQKNYTIKFYFQGKIHNNYFLKKTNFNHSFYDDDDSG